MEQTCETETVVPFLVAMKKKIVGMEINLRKWLKMHKIVLGVNGNDKKENTFQKRPNKTDKKKNKMVVMMVVDGGYGDGRWVLERTKSKRDG